MRSMDNTHGVRNTQDNAIWQKSPANFTRNSSPLWRIDELCMYATVRVSYPTLLYSTLHVLLARIHGTKSRGSGGGWSTAMPAYASSASSASYVREPGIGEA